MYTIGAVSVPVFASRFLVLLVLQRMNWRLRLAACAPLNKLLYIYDLYRSGAMGAIVVGLAGLRNLCHRNLFDALPWALAFKPLCLAVRRWAKGLGMIRPFLGWPRRLPW